MLAAVEGAGVLYIVTVGFQMSYGCPCAEAACVGGVLCHFRWDALVDHDVVSQNAVDGGIPAVDLLGEPIELAGIVDVIIAVTLRIGSGLIFVTD